MIRDDFRCYRYIFAIDPGYSFKNGAGYAIFDHETFKLIACGIVRPFAPGMDDYQAAIEIANKLRQIWEKHVGFSFDPVYLVVEGQRIYPFSKINPDPLIKLARLSGMLLRDYKTPEKNVLTPCPGQWKGNSAKLDTANLVLENLDPWSIRRLNNDLSEIPKFLHHNVYDAVGLGLWAIENFTKENFKK